MFTWQISQGGSLLERVWRSNLWCLLASLFAAWTSTSHFAHSAASSAQQITVAGAFSHTSHWIFIFPKPITLSKTNHNLSLTLSITTLFFCVYETPICQMSSKMAHNNFKQRSRNTQLKSTRETFQENDGSEGKERESSGIYGDEEEIGEGCAIEYCCGVWWTWRHEEREETLGGRF